MDPRDFLNTAAFLNGQSDEHYLRTSISRSYYAVHLHIRSFISNTYLGGKKFNKSPHMNIILCLNRCEVGEVKVIGSMLNDLLQARKDADYEMDKTISSKKSEDIYEDSNELLSDFYSVMAVPANKQKFAKSSRQQARFERVIPL